VSYSNWSQQLPLTWLRVNFIYFSKASDGSDPSSLILRILSSFCRRGGRGEGKGGEGKGEGGEGRGEEGKGEGGGRGRD
jgi:hypothetical protein